MFEGFLNSWSGRVRKGHERLVRIRKGLKGQEGLVRIEKGPKM